MTDIARHARVAVLVSPAELEMVWMCVVNATPGIVGARLAVVLEHEAQAVVHGCWVTPCSPPRVRFQGKIVVSHVSARRP